MKKGNFIIITLCLALILTGCQYKSIAKEIDPSFQTCVEKAKELIPENFTIYDHGGGKIQYPSWKDRVEIRGAREIIFVPGDEEGQNINYRYPEDFFSKEPSSLSYSKKIIASDGTIIGTRSFNVKLILKPIPHTENVYMISEVVKYPNQVFEVVESEFVSCNWVEKPFEEPSFYELNKEICEEAAGHVKSSCLLDIDEERSLYFTECNYDVKYKDYINEICLTVQRKDDFSGSFLTICNNCTKNPATLTCSFGEKEGNVQAMLGLTSCEE